MRAIFLATLLGTVTALPAQAQGTREYGANEHVDELVHSDLPLYAFDWEELWPRSIADEEIIAGCSSRVRFGDWFMQSNPANQGSLVEGWYNFSNYGSFHCIANVATARQREDLETGELARGFFVKLGEAERSGSPMELWALQTGTSPGSDYRLLARAPDQEIVTSFEVLQQRCPAGHWRALADEDAFDIFSTGYCSINTREELFALATDMLSRPALGTLTLQEDPESGVSQR